jgi:hypothetical protein
MIPGVVDCRHSSFSYQKIMCTVNSQSLHRCLSHFINVDDYRRRQLSSDDNQWLIYIHNDVTYIQVPGTGRFAETLMHSAAERFWHTVATLILCLIEQRLATEAKSL